MSEIVRKKLGRLSSSAPRRHRKSRGTARCFFLLEREEKGEVAGRQCRLRRWPKISTATARCASLPRVVFDLDFIRSEVVGFYQRRGGVLLRTRNVFTDRSGRVYCKATSGGFIRGLKVIIIRQVRVEVSRALCLTSLTGDTCSLR